MEYNFDERNCVTGICSMKNDWYEFNSLWNHTAAEQLPFPKNSYINMGIAEMEFPVAAPIREALHRRIDKKCLGYTYSMDPSYRRLVADWAKRHYNWDILPEQTSISEGVLAGLERLIRMTIPAESKVLLATPVYSPFRMVVGEAGCKLETTQLIYENGYYRFDWEDLKQKLEDPEVKGFLLCNPHNPVGRLWSPEELKKIGELCFSQDVFVFSDEIHCDMIRSNNTHTPFGKMFPDEKRWTVCISPGKTFNLSGLTFSNVIIPDEKIMQRWVNAIGVSATNTLSMEAARAAYSVCDDWLEQVRKYIDGNFVFTKAFLKEHLPEIEFEIPEGTYFAWVDFSKYHLPGNLHTFFFEKAAIDVDHGDGFLGGNRNFVRLMLACTRNTLETALTRICDTVNQNQ